MRLEMDASARAENLSDIDRVERILRSGIFSIEQQENPLVISALIELLIRTRDLLAKAEKFSRRVSFKDDVVFTSKIQDVTDLIVFARDCACHIDSFKHGIDDQRIRVSFNLLYGAGVFAKHGERRLESQYGDEVAFFFGEQRVYLYRHILRAYKEAVTRLHPLSQIGVDA